VLAKDKLQEQLKTERLQELTAKGDHARSSESFQLMPADYQRLLRATFAAKFGTNIAAILRTNQLVLASTNQAHKGVTASTANKPRPSFYHRALAFIGLEHREHRSKAEKHLPKADRLALGQMTPELMVKLLAGQIPITNDDYVKLINARAHAIQTWFLESGQVTAERLLLTTPKPVAEGYQGSAQVKLSLD
jgi:hypothetical protein